MASLVPVAAVDAADAFASAWVLCYPPSDGETLFHAHTGFQAQASWSAIDVGASAQVSGDGTASPARGDVSGWFVQPTGGMISAYNSGTIPVPVGTFIYAKSEAQVAAVFSAQDAAWAGTYCLPGSVPNISLDNVIERYNHIRCNPVPLDASDSGGDSHGGGSDGSDDETAPDDAHDGPGGEFLMEDPEIHLLDENINDDAFLAGSSFRISYELLLELCKLNPSNIVGSLQ